MEVLLNILLIEVVGTFNLTCFFLGAKIGNRVANGKEVEAPQLKTPMQAFRERQDSKEAKKELERIETIMANIENYDGTSNYQKDVPRG